MDHVERISPIAAFLAKLYVMAADDQEQTWYHGTPDDRHWDTGAAYGIHVGTEEAARQALNARIGKPAEGEWDGTREYGKTLLNRDQEHHAFDHGTRTWTHHVTPQPPEYPSGRASYSSGHPVPMDARPNVFPVRIKGPMVNEHHRPVTDDYANSRIRNQITRGNARRGYYYTNVGEDEGSISAAVPSAAHLERTAATRPVEPGPPEAEEYEGTYGNTAHITRNESGMIPTAAVAHLQGARGEQPGEHRNRQGAAWDAFKADIAEHGIQEPIFITADPGQEPKISEGSHRRDAAVELGHTHIPYRARYYGHAEQDGLVADREPATPAQPSPQRRKEATAMADRMSVNDLLNLHSNEALRRERARSADPQMVGHSNATRVRTLYDRKAADLASNPHGWSALDEPIRKGTIDPVLLEHSSSGHTVVSEGAHRIVRAHQLGVTHLPVSHDPGSQAHGDDWDEPEPLDEHTAALETTAAIGHEELDQRLEGWFHPQHLEAERTTHPRSGHQVATGLERRLHHPDQGEGPVHFNVLDHGDPHEPGRNSLAYPKRAGTEPVQHVYRGVSAEEWRQARERGHIQSDGRGTIAGWEGTNADPDPRSAVSYLPRNAPGHVLKIRVHPDDGWFTHHADGYVRTRQPIPLDRVEGVSPEITKGGKYGNEITVGEHEPTDQHTAALDPAEPHAGGLLPNPMTGHHDWYHGTQASREELADGFEDPAGHADEAYETPEEEPSGHWNRFLGTHFAASHELAGAFAGGDHSSGDNDRGYDAEPAVVHAHLQLKNPKVYGSEHDIDDDLYEHEHRSNPLSEHLDHYEGEEDSRPSAVALHQKYGDREIPRGVSSHIPGIFGIPSYHPDRSVWVNSHPDRFNMAMRFKKRLEAAGHDGIVYGNEYEDSGENHPHANTAAIAFHPHQIQVTRHHDADDENDAPEPIRHEAAADTSYRGWHQAPGGPDDDVAAPMHDAEGVMPKVYDRPELYRHPGIDNSETERQMRRARGNPEADITVYRSQPHGQRAINKGDWVTPSAAYARQHSQSNTEGDGEQPVVKATVKAKHLFSEGYTHEWGYQGPDVEHAEIHHPGTGAHIASADGDAADQVAEKHGVSPGAAADALDRVRASGDADGHARDYGFAGVGDTLPSHVISHVNKPGAWEGVPVTGIPASEIHASQNWIKPSLVMHNLRHPGEPEREDAPVGGLGATSRFVRRSSGQIQQVDGHHRTAADLLLGKPYTPGKILDEDQIPKPAGDPVPKTPAALREHLNHVHGLAPAELPDDDNDLTDEHERSHEYEGDYLGHTHRTAAALPAPARHGFSPIAQATEALDAAMAGYDPGHMGPVSDWLGDLPTFYDQQGIAFGTMATRLREEYPLAPEVADHYEGLSATLAELADQAAEGARLFRTAHRHDLDRLENPRTNEDRWDARAE